MREYLSIGEVSKLKGVSVKSLRYYDEMHILKPAYVNPDTGYRYYTQEQLVTLDVIMMCVELNIPLKRFGRYQDESGALRLDRILEDGQEIARRQAARIQATLARMRRLADSIEAYRRYKDRKGEYRRFIGERNLLTEPWNGAPDDARLFMRTASGLFLRAEEMGLTSVYQQGLVYFYRLGRTDKYVFIEVLEPGPEAPGRITLPGGEYRCLRLDVSGIEGTAGRFGCAGEELEGLWAVDVDLYDASLERGGYPVELQLFAGGADRA
ncbi:MerR family transcriptional regulator [Paenibacillus glufosinatiresistens]|uniref:MerR family transcriptional regulator n=1 Tax=Paenibacillus glufosinatiresistens TaxID=3070657 RepID=UPI00286E883D|nr:helix-turn-helix domain-containing protein [Paenibacillus sp. YX.27]